MLYKSFPFLSNIATRTIFIVCVAILPFTSVKSQQINGTTGLLVAPSAQMQRDRTVMIGGNYLNQHILPDAFKYNSFNYYLNVTFLPFMEVAYTCTLIRQSEVGGTFGKFINQDRNFSIRLRAIKESKYIPAIVVGSSDAYTTKGSFISQNKSNQYFGNIYLAMSKHFSLGQEQIGTHLSYIYGPRSDGQLNGVAAGVDYVPSFAQNLTFIAEYDTKSFNVGAQVLLFKHLFAQAILQDMRYFSAGLACKIYLFP